MRYWFICYKIVNPEGIQWVNSRIITMHPFLWAKDRSIFGTKVTIIDYHQVDKEDYDIYCDTTDEL